MMLILSLLLAVLALAAIIAGVVVGLVAAALVLGLTLSGTALGSAVLGISRRSPSLGFMAFVVQLSALAGLVLGGIAGMLYCWSEGMPLFSMAPTGIWALTGFITCGLAGWVLFRVWIELWRKAVAWWLERKQRIECSGGL